MTPPAAQGRNTSGAQPYLLGGASGGGDCCARDFALAFHQPDAPEDDDGAIPDWDDYEEEHENERA